MSYLSFRESNYKEKELKEQTDMIGKKYRERTTTALVGVTRNVILLLGPPTPSMKPHFGLGSASKAIIAAIPNRKRKGSKTDLTP